MSVATTSQYAHRTRWLVDSGATDHATHDRNLLFDIEELKGSARTVITTANGCLYPTLRGKIRMQVTRTNGTSLELTLLNVNYIPEIPVNLFSSSAAEEKGAYIDNRSHTLRKADTNTELCALDKIGKQKFLKSYEVQVHITLLAITLNQLEV